MTEPAKEKKKTGRRTKLTPEVSKIIIDTVSEGNTLTVAAALAGIHIDTIFEWDKRGQEEGKGMFYEFSEALTRAKASAQQKAVRALVNAFDNDPKMALEYLSRRYPEDWAKKDNLKVDAKHDGVIKIVVEEVDGGSQ